MSKDFFYFPTLKTTQAELKAYEHLDDKIKNSVLPVFELTKSRKTKKNKESRLEKKIDKLSKIIKKRPFILDLTVDPTYSNREIDEFLSGNDGYKAWITFLLKLKKTFKFIPTIHYHHEKQEDVQVQINKLNDNFKHLSIRVEVFKEETMVYLKNMFSMCSDLEKKTILIMDGKFISKDDINNLKRFSDAIKEARTKFKNCFIIPTFSSFPRAVTEYGEDSYGEFSIKEIETNKKIIDDNNNVYHGDYGAIHPIRYTGGWGWVPRIDVPFKNSCFYYRYRRDGGSYTRCAEEVIEDSKYSKINGVNSWGDEEIEFASKGEPRGKSPSHWIAVRSNLHMTRQALRLKKLNQALSLSL